MIKLQLDGVKCVDDIKAAIYRALAGETIVSYNKEVGELFAENYPDCEVFHREILNESVSIWNQNLKTSDFYQVRIWEHYCDPGSCDYIYSYEVI